MSNQSSSSFSTIVGTNGLAVTVLPGSVSVNGVLTNIPQTIVQLVKNSVNSIYLSSLGVLTSSTTGFPAGSIPISTVTCTNNSIGNIVDARPDFTLGSASGSGRAVVGGILSISVANLKVVPLGGFFAMGSGDTDIYTVPTGKKAIPVDCIFTNPTGSGGTVVCFAEIKVSGVYTKYDFICNGVAAGTIGNTALLAPMLLNTGESFSVNIDNAGRLSLWPYILEFDDPGNLFVSRLSSLAVGDNTVLIVPNDGISILSNIESVGAGSPLKGTVWYFNNTGVSRTIGWNVVPNGGSIANANQILTGSLVNSPAILVKNFYGGLKQNDFFSVNTDANTAGQIAWINYQIN